MRSQRYIHTSKSQQVATTRQETLSRRAHQQVNHQYTKEGPWPTKTLTNYQHTITTITAYIRNICQRSPSTLTTPTPAR